MQGPVGTHAARCSLPQPPRQVGEVGALTSVKSQRQASMPCTRKEPALPPTRCLTSYVSRGGLRDVRAVSAGSVALVESPRLTGGGGDRAPCNPRCNRAHTPRSSANSPADAVHQLIPYACHPRCPRAAALGLNSPARPPDHACTQSPDQAMRDWDLDGTCARGGQAVLQVVIGPRLDDRRRKQGGVASSW